MHAALVIAKHHALGDLLRSLAVVVRKGLFDRLERFESTAYLSGTMRERFAGEGLAQSLNPCLALAIFAVELPAPTSSPALRWRSCRCLGRVPGGAGDAVASLMPIALVSQELFGFAP